MASGWWHGAGQARERRRRAGSHGMPGTWAWAAYPLPARVLCMCLCTVATVYVHIEYVRLLYVSMSSPLRIAHLGRPRIGALSIRHRPLPFASLRLVSPCLAALARLRVLRLASSVFRRVATCANTPGPCYPLLDPPAVETPVTFLRFISPTHLLKLPPTCGLLL